MKDHRVAEYINDLRDVAIKYGEAQQLRERIHRIVVEMLIEQDRDTRHACSEKIIQYDKDVRADCAHNICMNTQEGLPKTLR